MHIFTKNQIADLRAQFKTVFPKNIILDACENFSWQGKSASEANHVRESVAASFHKWAENGFENEIFHTQIQAVHRWGFGSDAPAHLFNEPNKTALIQCLLLWHKDSDIEQKQDSLSTALGINGVKIARHSKWLCFLDHKRFAIYDSRVSLALRSLNINDKRAFPTVGRRSTKEVIYPNATYIGNTEAKRNAYMSKSYINFLALLDSVNEDYQLENICEIEKALFMLGNQKQYW
jgi:hypothetical protein